MVFSILSSTWKNPLIKCFNPSLKVDLSSLKMATTVQLSLDFKKILKSYNHCLHVCNLDMPVYYMCGRQQFVFY